MSLLPCNRLWFANQRSAKTIAIPTATSSNLSGSLETRGLGQVPLPEDFTDDQNMEINGRTAGSQYDQINVGGPVTLDGFLFPILSSSFASTIGDQFTLVNNTSTFPTTGTLGMPEGGVYTLNNQRFQISYHGGTGNDVVLTHINTPPTAENLQITPGKVNEGDTVTLTGNLTDPDLLDQLTLRVDWGDSIVEDYAPGRDPFAIPHRYLNNPHGQTTGDYTIHVNWLDDSGQGNSRDLTVTVNNVAPVLAELAVASPIQVGDFANLAGSIIDPGELDAFTLAVAWGDGGTNSYSYVPGTLFFGEDHQYLEAGTYTIQLTVSDDDGGTSTGSIDIVVQGGGNVPPGGAGGSRLFRGAEAAFVNSSLFGALVPSSSFSDHRSDSSSLEKVDRLFARAADRASEMTTAPADLRADQFGNPYSVHSLASNAQAEGRRELRLAAFDDLFASAPALWERTSGASHFNR